MIYTWRCDSCGEEVDIQRPADDYLIPPDGLCEVCGKDNWIKLISSGTSTPFETLRDRGVLDRLPY